MAASSQQLSASSEQSAQASNQVAGTIAEVAAGVARQLQEVDETSNIEGFWRVMYNNSIKRIMGKPSKRKGRKAMGLKI